MRGDGETVCADGLSESEQGVVAPEIFEGFLIALVDFDLFDGRIAFDVKNPFAGEQVRIEFLRPAHIQDRVGFPIKLANAGKGKAGRRSIGEITRTKTPAAAEPKFRAEAVQQSRRVIELVVYLEGLRVVRQPGRVLDVEDVVAEALQANDVMEVLPDDAGDGA